MLLSTLQTNGKLMRTTSVDLEERQKDVVEEMAKNGDAATASEAIRDAIEHYAQEQGYENGQKRQTALRSAIQRVGDAAALAGIIWLGFTLAMPVGFRFAAIGMLLGAMVCYGAERALGRVEPRVSQWLVWGERA